MKRRSVACLKSLYSLILSLLFCNVVVDVPVLVVSSPPVLLSLVHTSEISTSISTNARHTHAQK